MKIRGGNILKNYYRYTSKILSVEYDNLIGFWANNEESGAVAVDLSSRGNNGAHTSVTLKQPGIGDGRFAALYNGSASYTNIYSTGLRDDLNGAEMTLLQWIRMRALSVWSDGVTRYGSYFFAGGNDRFGIRKLSNNNFEFTTVSGGTNKSHSIIAPTDIDWMCVILTVSEGNDRSISYKDAVQNSVTTGLGAWGGTISSAVLGAGDLVPNGGHDGWVGPSALWATELNLAQIEYLSSP
jgi:hypothetical protein